MMYTVKVWLLVAALAVAALVGAVSGYAVKSLSCRADVAEARLKASQYEQRVLSERLAYESDLRNKQAEANAALRKVTDEYTRREKTLRASAASAKSELNRLRDQANVPVPASAFTDNPPPPAGADDATVTRYVLGECGAAVSTLAEAADAAEAKLSALQDYVVSVTKALGLTGASDAGKL